MSLIKPQEQEPSPETRNRTKRFALEFIGLALVALFSALASFLGTLAAPNLWQGIPFGMIFALTALITFWLSLRLLLPARRYMLTSAVVSSAVAVFYGGSTLVPSWPAITWILAIPLVSSFLLGMPIKSAAAPSMPVTEPTGEAALRHPDNFDAKE